MKISTSPFGGDLAGLIESYHASGFRAEVKADLQRLARESMPDAVVVAAEPHLGEPMVTVALYEVIVESQPTNARALVVLANALWLLGAGPDAVQELAQRAIAADGGNRGAWHLWALSESAPRERTLRWRQVAERFPEDDLALANVADNATAVAGAEQDYEMLDMALAAYETLLARAPNETQRAAVEGAVRALRGWKF